MFHSTRFIQTADFEGAKFKIADFRNSRFRPQARFINATFEGTAIFQGANFRQEAIFGDATFTKDARFDNANFKGGAWFDYTSFEEGAFFDQASFGGPGSFGSTTFGNDARFTGATLGDFTVLGPCKVAGTLLLDRARLGASVEVTCQPAVVDARGLIAPEGGLLQLGGRGPVDIAGAKFGAPATIAIAIGDEPSDSASDDATAAGVEAPALRSLTKVDTTHLTLAGLNLRSCRFLGAYNLDQLRIDGRPILRGFLGPRRTKRLSIYDEQWWRARYDRRPEGWLPDQVEDQPAAHSQRSTAAAGAEARRIQGIYRELRKSREDAKDEPGAADFYYGEMEMRRLAAPPRSVERTLLTAYWAASGYGLRATRALSALLVLLLIGPVVFATVGFDKTQRLEIRPTARDSATGAVAYQQVSAPGPRPGVLAAAHFSIESSTSLLRGPTPRRLTPLGQSMEIALRLLGPLLLGLALLAIRSRVKR